MDGYANETYTVACDAERASECNNCQLSIVTAKFAKSRANLAVCCKICLCQYKYCSIIYARSVYGT